jgi:hypothetical protein
MGMRNDELEYTTEPHITYTPCYVLVILWVG